MMCSEDALPLGPGLAVQLHGVRRPLFVLTLVEG